MACRIASMRSLRRRSSKNNLRIKGGKLNGTGPWYPTCSIEFSKKLNDGEHLTAVDLILMFCYCSGILLVTYQDQEVFLPGANWTLYLWFLPCSDVSDTGDNRSQETTQGVLALLLVSVALMHYWLSTWPDFWRRRNFFPLRLSVTVVWSVAFFPPPAGSFSWRIAFIVKQIENIFVLLF